MVMITPQGTCKAKLITDNRISSNLEKNERVDTVFELLGLTRGNACVYGACDSAGGSRISAADAASGIHH